VRPAEITGVAVAIGLGAVFYGAGFSLPRRSRP
jgi:hypothetical protein